MVPTPVQAAMVAALDDDEHQHQQRERYAERRAVLLAAFDPPTSPSISPMPGGLYPWATRGEPCRDTVAWLAERGIPRRPGEFYGPRGQHVRVALTATDERIAAAAARLAY